MTWSRIGFNIFFLLNILYHHACIADNDCGQAVSLIQLQIFYTVYRAVLILFVGSVLLCREMGEGVIFNFVKAITRLCVGFWCVFLYNLREIPHVLIYLIPVHVLYTCRDVTAIQ